MSINRPENSSTKPEKLPRVGKLFPRKSETFTDQEILPGLKIEVITYPQQPDTIMGYIPQTDNIYIFGGAYDAIDQGRYAVVDLAGLHESDHANYFRLPVAMQKASNDLILGLIATNNEAKQYFIKFVQALYRRPKANYLDTHLFSNQKVKAIISHDDHKPGLKDLRFLDVDVDESGKTRKVYLGLVMTEFFAYMSAGHHPITLLDGDTLENINVKKILANISIFRKKFIDPNPTVIAKLRWNGGHGLRRPIPNFRKYLIDE